VGLIPLSVFKSEAWISNRAVEYAMEKQKLAVKRGNGSHNDRNVMIALDAQGRQQFYELFHERQRFPSAASNARMRQGQSSRIASRLK